MGANVFTGMNKIHITSIDFHAKRRNTPIIIDNAHTVPQQRALDYGPSLGGLNQVYNIPQIWVWD